MPDSTYKAPQIWPEDTTALRAAELSLQRTSAALASFIVADHDKNDRAMIEAIKSIRAVATRMDQFRRRQVRRWSEAAPQNLKTETTHT